MQTSGNHKCCLALLHAYSTVALPAEVHQNKEGNPGSALQVLGTDDFYEYLGKYGLQLDPQLESLVGQHTKKPWAKFINADNEHLVSEEAIDFLDKILCYDHQQRLTCQEAMAHAYFDPVRDEIMKAANAEVAAPVAASNSA